VKRLWREDWLNDDVLKETTRAVVAAGEVIKMVNPEFKAKKGEGHRSGVTESDKMSHRMVFERLAQRFPQAKFLSEEGEEESPRLFSKNDPRGIFQEELVVIFDPIDGTAPFGSMLGTWCVAAAVMRYGWITGSAIYAPALNGGLLVVAEKDNGVRIKEWNFEKEIKVPSTSEVKKISDCFVTMGVDATLYRQFMGIVPEIGRNVRAWGLANSGILGLAQVAAGRLQAIFEPPQKVWDWAPGFLAVLESGNTIRFFRLVPEPDSEFSVLIPVDDYDYEAFCLFPQQNRLGYVAGQPQIVDFIFDLLPKKGWSRLNPDTI